MSRYFDDISIAADAIHLEARKSGIDMGRTTARRMATVAMEVFRREDLEEPQRWCWTTERGWVLMDGSMARLASVPEYQRYGNGNELVRIYGTTADRDAKRDALLEAARKAGKP